jgi:hypothetical protein
MAVKTPSNSKTNASSSPRSCGSWSWRLRSARACMAARDGSPQAAPYPTRRVADVRRCVLGGRVVLRFVGGRVLDGDRARVGGFHPGLPCGCGYTAGVGADVAQKLRALSRVYALTVGPSAWAVYRDEQGRLQRQR